MSAKTLKALHPSEKASPPPTYVLCITYIYLSKSLIIQLIELQGK